MAKSRGGASKAKGKKAPSGAHSRAQGDGRIGLVLLDGPPDAPEREGPHAALLDGNPHVHFDGENEWGWKALPDGRAVFGWTEGGAFRDSELVNNPSGMLAVRRADGGAYLLQTHDCKAWEVSAETGRADLLHQGRDVFALAYLGPDRAWIGTGRFVHAYVRKGGRLELEARTNWRLELVSARNDRVLILIDNDRETALVLVATPRGPVIADRFSMKTYATRNDGGRVILFAHEGDGVKPYEVTGLDELLAHVDGGGDVEPFAFPAQGSFTDEQVARIERDEEPPFAAALGGHAKGAEKGRVGLAFLGFERPAALANVSASARDAARVGRNATVDRGVLLGWKPEGPRAFRFVWVENGALRESDVVSDRPSRLGVVSPDGSRILVGKRDRDRELWEVDRKTAKGARVFDLTAEIYMAAHAAHGRVLCATERGLLLFTADDDGGWEFAQGTELVVSDIATGAGGRIVAVACPEGDGALLRVWAQTERGLVKVSEFSAVPVDELFAVDDRVFVRTKEREWYELTGLTAAADAAAKSRKGYAEVDLQEEGNGEPDVVPTRDEEVPEQLGRKGTKGKVGLEPTDDFPPDRLTPANLARFDSVIAREDGEHAWGWKRYASDRYVFAWLDGGELRESRFESNNPGEHTARKADGSAYLVTVGPRAVWEVRADTGRATLVTELDHVSALAYFGERHAWVCGSSAVLTFARKGDRLELESTARDREFVSAIVTVLGDRIAVLETGVGARAYVVVSTDAGPVLGEKFKFGSAGIQGWKGRALALNGEATGGAWEFTHLEEALAQAQAGKGRRFEFPRRPKGTDEGGGDEAPATYEREAAEGRVGLRLLSMSMSLPFACDPPADDAAEALVDSADTKSAGGLAFGWRRERKRKFRYVWAEGGVARESDVVSDGDPSAHKVGFDRRRFLVVTGGNESKLWAIDRATGRGSLVFYDPDETVMTATDAAPDRVLLATTASVSIHVPKDGGWAFERSGGMVARGMATGANGRIIAFGGEEQGLTVWAVTSRGVVQVDTLDVEGILSIAEHEQRLVVHAGRKLVSYELTNLAAVVDAAERDTEGERYPAVDLEASIREAMAAMDEAGESGDKEGESPEGE